jgi:hypothetical protein
LKINDIIKKNIQKHITQNGGFNQYHAKCPFAAFLLTNVMEFQGYTNTSINTVSMQYAAIAYGITY